MPQGRGNVQYAVAGTQSMPGVRMNVRSSEYVPGGDSDERASFYAGKEPPARRFKSPTVTRKSAFIFLTLLIIGMFFIVATKLYERSQISKDISRMYQEIAATAQKTQELERKVIDARDSVRICYLAVQKYGMVSEEGVETFYLYASREPYDGGSYYRSAAHSPMIGTQSAGLTH